MDLVDVLGRLITGLQPALDRLTASPGELSAVFGAVHAGDAANVIPAHGSLRGSLRTKDHDTWLKTPELFEQALIDVLGDSAAAWEIHHRRGVPPVINDPALTEVLASAVRSSIGPDAVVATEQSMGGDSFAWYLERVPGSYGRLGTHDPTSIRPRLDLHASTFDVDERSIRVGVLSLVTAALDALSRPTAQR